MKKIILALVAWLALIPLAHSADVAISGLPAASSVDATDTTVIIQGGTTKKATISLVMANNAATATALAANPTDCSANNYATAIAANGNLTCGQISLSAGISGFGTGVATALGVNVGSAGAPVLINGAGGTPSSITLTNATGTAASLTAGTASAVAVGGITGLGTGVATALAVNVGSAGAPVVLNGAGGTPSSLTGTNITGTASGLTAGAATALAANGANCSAGNYPLGVDASGAVESCTAAVTASTSDVFTNKTFDAAATGNALKFKSYLYLTHPHLCDGTNATIGTTTTAIDYGHATFSNSVDQATNYCEYYIQVPEDIDTSVALRARIKVRLGGADTASQRYVLSSVSVADSAVPTSSTLANAINVDFAGDASGASGDVETSAWTTLTSWAGALTAGQTWRIRFARDGDTSDASTVNSTELGLVIEYGATQ